MSSMLKAAFILQARHCSDLGSPFMAAWCKMFAQRLTPENKIGAALHSWPGDASAGGDNVPLRLMGALHHLVLNDKCAALTAVYPPNFEGKTEPELWAGASAAFDNHTDFILRQIQSPPQTNEVRRSGILLPGFLTIAEQTDGLPFIMSELGASAGLNMNWDKYHYSFGGQNWGDENAPVKLAPDWSGPVPTPQTIEVIERAACDLKPTDLSDPDAVTNLLSYLWPDQKNRITRTRAAIEMTKTHPVQVDEMDAIDWLEDRLAAPRENTVHVIYHTIAWQYFPNALKAKGRALIEAAGAKATVSAPLAWLAFEADGNEPGGALTLAIWPSGKTKTLARADYHGRWVDWV